MVILTLRDILLTTALPVLTAVAVALMLRPFRRLRPAAPALAIAFAYGLAHAALFTPRAPFESRDWLCLAVLPAAAIAALACTVATGPWRKVSRAALPALRELAAFAVPPLLLQAYLRDHWSPAQAALWCIGLGMGLFVGWTLLHRLARRTPTPLTALALTAAGAGIVVSLSDSFTVGQLGIALAAAVLGGRVASRRAGSAARAAGVGVAWVVLASLLIIARFYAEAEPADVKYLLLAVAPLGGWVGEWPIFQRRGWTCTVLARWIAVLAPIAAAITLAAMQFADEWRGPGM